MIITFMEYIGIAAFALSGSFVAIKRRMDLLGIYIISFVSAIGGGLLRDVVMSQGVPVFFSSYGVMWTVLISATVGILLRGRFRYEWLIVVLDAIGLSVFAIDTGVKAIAAGYNFPSFLFVSTITAVGGGVIRDLLCLRVPHIFRRDIYALAAMAGAVLLWGLARLIPIELAEYISLAFVFLSRLLCFRFGLSLPVVGPKGAKK